MIPRLATSRKLSIRCGVELWWATDRRWCENLEEKLEPCKFGDGLSRHYFSHHWWLGRGMNFVQVPRASGVSHQLSETLIQCTVKH